MNRITETEKRLVYALVNWAEEIELEEEQTVCVQYGKLIEDLDDEIPQLFRQFNEEERLLLPTDSLQAEISREGNEFSIYLVRLMGSEEIEDALAHYQVDADSDVILVTYFEWR